VSIKPHSVAGNDSLTLADDVKKYDTNGLISVAGTGLRLSEKTLKILENEDILFVPFSK